MSSSSWRREFANLGDRFFLRSFSHIKYEREEKEEEVKKKKRCSVLPVLLFSAVVVRVLK